MVWWKFHQPPWDKDLWKWGFLHSIYALPRQSVHLLYILGLVNPSNHQPVPSTGFDMSQYMCEKGVFCCSSFKSAVGVGKAVFHIFFPHSNLQNGGREGYVGKKEFGVPHNSTDTRRMGTSKAELMSWTSQPQSVITVHSVSHHYPLSIAQYLCRSPSSQCCFQSPCIMLSEKRQKVQIFTPSLTEGSCDNYDEWIRSCEEARINEGMKKQWWE